MDVLRTLHESVLRWCVVRGVALLRCTLITAMTLTLLLTLYTLLQLLQQTPALLPPAPLIFPTELVVRSRGYTAHGCTCVRFGHDLASLQSTRLVGVHQPWRLPEWFLGRYSQGLNSTCSDYATQRGAGQKVVSYSYYSPYAVTREGSPHHRKYMKQLYGRARTIAQVYPGWVVRVYHNVSLDDHVAVNYMCKLFCHLSNVDLCHVNNLPTLGNLGKRQPVGRTWRFAVIGDPTVSWFMSRDTDSYILDREVAAVREWLQSGKGYHVMRDHPHHKAIMLAGLWGGHNKFPNDMAQLRDEIFAAPANLTKKYDQYLLATKLWPIVKDDVLQHDSYHCELHTGARPFPTRRKDWRYCGFGPYKVKERQAIVVNYCPKVCRPPDHPQWIWC